MIAKFRAWHKPTESIREVESIDFRRELFDLAGGEIDQESWDIVLMQATGLQDKNGVDIFEGDIIKTGETLDWLNEDIGVIRFLDGAFFIDYHNLDTEFDYIGNISLPIEVVGNIYENSELLEEQS